ncbi:MAG: glutamate--tRNA ligase family protein, partial [Candidatus Bilamarchaeaceae archaeon]
AKAFCLSAEIARKYKGKIILRWDDTNPEAEKEEFVHAIRDGIKWLGLHWDSETYCSDHMQEMYKLCEKLIMQGDAYGCTCTQEEIGKAREEKKRCPCGSKSPEENLEFWRKMLKDMPEGEGTIRLKGDMASENTVMRDPALFRIIASPHYRQGNKYRVWPTYDFQGAVMDSFLGITHPLRSKEYELRDELYEYLLKRLGLRVPKMLTISRLSLKNAPVSKRLLRPLVESGELLGWDDPRLPTLMGLKRRGILPEAIRAFVLSFGLSKVESEPGWEILLSENRKLLDPVAEHYFFVPNPVKLVVKGAPEKEACLKTHPKKEEFRKYKTKGIFYIPSVDLKELKTGDIFRLKDLYNVKIAKKGRAEILGEYAGEEMLSCKKLQWVSDEHLECECWKIGDLLKDEKFSPSSLIKEKGLAEKAVEKLEEGETVQFERYGFCRLDSKNPLVFIHSC